MKTGKALVNEFEQYIVDAVESDGELYRRFYRPLVENYARKKLEDIYDTDKAIKGVMPLVVMGIKKYTPEAERYFGRKFEGTLKPGILLRQHVAVELVAGMQSEINDIVREKSKGKKIGNFTPFQNFTDAKIKDWRIFGGHRFSMMGTYWHEDDLNRAIKQLAGEFHIKKVKLASGAIALYGRVHDRKSPKRVGYWGHPGFQNPGSALCRSSKSNPRKYPCPTCKQPNRLTAQDVARHYQCDACANRDEGCGCY